VFRICLCLHQHLIQSFLPHADHDRHREALNSPMRNLFLVYVGQFIYANTEIHKKADFIHQAYRGGGSSGFRKIIHAKHQTGTFANTGTYHGN
jgi:hypothetical protein